MTDGKETKDFRDDLLGETFDFLYDLEKLRKLPTCTPRHRSDNERGKHD